MHACSLVHTLNRHVAVAVAVLLLLFGSLLLFIVHSFYIKSLLNPCINRHQHIQIQIKTLKNNNETTRTTTTATAMK